MTELVAPPPTPKSAAEYRAAIDRLLAEMQQWEGRMEQDRREIERLRAKSQAITRHTDGVLERLDELIGALGKAA